MLLCPWRSMRTRRQPAATARAQTTATATATATETAERCVSAPERARAHVSCAPHAQRLTRLCQQVPAGYSLLGSGDDASEPDSDDDNGGETGPGGGRPAPAPESTAHAPGEPSDARGVARGDGIIPAAFPGELPAATTEVVAATPAGASNLSAEDATSIRMAMSGFALPAPGWARELDVSPHTRISRQMHTAPTSACLYPRCATAAGRERARERERGREGASERASERERERESARASESEREEKREKEREA